MLELESVGLWIGTDEGLLQARRDGTEVHEAGLPPVEVRELAVGPEGTLFVGTWGRGLFRSRDGGRTFEPASDGLPCETVTALAVASESAAILYAGCEPAAVAMSTDAGETWQGFPELTMASGASRWWAPWGTPDLSAVLPDPEDPQRFYVGIEVGGVYVTRDDGQTFEARKEGLHEDVHALAAHAAAPHVLWAATGGGIYRSENRGRSWEERVEGLDRTYTPALALHPQEPNVAIAAPAKMPPGRNSRLHRTDDAGESWRALTEGLPRELSGVERRALAWDPRDAESVYAGTISGEVWVSRNGGDAWDLLTDGIPPVHALAPHAAARI